MGADSAIGEIRGSSEGEVEWGGGVRDHGKISGRNRGIERAKELKLSGLR